MAKFCPECGAKLEEDYKFCPECGFKLGGSVVKDNSTDSTSKESVTKKTVEVVVCDNCGEENDPSADLCSSCGVKLQGEKISKEIFAAEEKPKPVQQVKPAPVVRKKTENKKSNTNAAKPEVEAKKKLNNIKLITIFAVGFGIAIILLLFSGILNSVIIPGASGNTASVQNQTSGVDLSNLQRINTLEQQIKDNPKDTAALLELAHIRNDAGMYQQAIEDYKKYLALVPKDPDARIDMGVCYYNLQDYNTAITEMETAIKYDPKHQIGYLNLGIVNLTAGNMEKAEEWLKKAVKLDPNSDYGKKAEELLKSHTSKNQTNGGK